MDIQYNLIFVKNINVGSIFVDAELNFDKRSNKANNENALPFIMKILNNILFGTVTIDLKDGIVVSIVSDEKIRIKQSIK